MVWGTRSDIGRVGCVRCVGGVGRVGYRRVESGARILKGAAMKIVVTAQGQELSSELDLRFGRAKWLLCMDTDGDGFAAHDNVVNLHSAQGAGIQTAQNVVNLGAEAVITGNVGPNAIRTLSAGGVKVFLAEAASVQEAVELFKAGALKEASEANVEGHWV